MEGWIKLHRKLIDSDIFKNEKGLKVWIWCLIRANHSDHSTLLGRTKVVIRKGSFIMGSHTAKESLDMAISTLWYWLRFLETEGMVEIKNTNKYSVIKLKNWNKFQAVENKSESNQQANGKQTETDKNVKNVENEKKEPDASVALPKTYNNFRDRARLKLGKEPMGSRPITQSQKRALAELAKIEPDIILYRSLALNEGFDYLELPEEANGKTRRQMLSARSRFGEDTPNFYRWIFTTTNPWPKKVNYHPESCITSIMFDAYKNRNSENKNNSILKSWGV